MENLEFQDPQGRLDQLEKQERQVTRVTQAQKEIGATKDGPASLDHKECPDHRVIQEIWDRLDHQDHLDHRVKPAREAYPDVMGIQDPWDHLVPLDHEDLKEMMAALGLQVHQAHLEDQELLDMPQYGLAN